jgi:hypothetical protein
VVDNPISLLSDENPSVRGRAAHVMGDIGELDRDITERLMSLLLDENEVPSVHWRAAYGLAKTGVVNEIILRSLEAICKNRDEYEKIFLDPEGDGYRMNVYDWAFRTLWRCTPSMIAEISSQQPITR